MPNFAVIKNNYSPLMIKIHQYQETLYLFTTNHQQEVEILIYGILISLKKYYTHLKNVTVFGEPLVNQIRNAHDYQKDYELEKDHIRANEIFIKVL